MNNSRTLASAFLIVFSFLILIGLVWAVYQFARFNLGGEGFSIQWITVQTFAREGTNPYSNQVTARIRESVPREDAFVADTFPRYTSPLYSGVVILPFTLISDKTLAHTLWMVAQLICIFAILLLLVKLTGWKPAWLGFALFSLFTLFSYHVVVPWLDGGLSIWAVFFFVIALVAIGSNRNEVGGVFLALSVIQPQMVILPVIFSLVWSISKKRTVIILWFLITLILLSVIAIFLVPNWIIDYARLLYNFSKNFPPGTPGIFFTQIWPGLGKQLSWMVSGIAILILTIEWVLAIKKDYRGYLWTICLTLVISHWIGIPTIPANYIELLIPLILIPALLGERWPRGGQWAASFIAIMLFAWEWALYYMNLTGSQPALQINLIFPLPAVLLIGLYWVRWQAIRPRRLLMEELRLSEIN